MTTTRSELLSPLLEGNEDAIISVRRWLSLNRDVIITGDVGSGRSLVLSELLTRATAQRSGTVLIRAAGDSPLSAFITQQSFAQTTSGNTVGEATSWLISELEGRHGVLLVDDLDDLDSVSASVIARVLRGTEIALVATARSARLQDLPPALLRLLSERAPAVERLVGLGFQGIYRLLAQALGGPVDVPLASAVLSRSGGNPRVALALASAARHSRVIDRDRGVWRKVGQFDDVPGEPVANALLGGLSDTDVRALELLSWLGPVREDTATALLDRESVVRLRGAGRVIEHPAGPGEDALITVAPPALSTALRSRVDDATANEFARTVGTLCGDDVPLPYLAERKVSDLLRGAGHRAEQDYHRWSAELADLALADAAAAEAALHREWQLTLTVSAANDYLRVLMRRPARALLEAVFTETRITGEETDDDLLQFCLQRAQWAAWSDLSAAEKAAFPFADDPRIAEVVQRLTTLRTAVYEGLTPEVTAWPVPEPTGIVWVDAWFAVVVAGALLDAGRPDLALEHADLPGTALPRTAVDYAEGIRALSLLMLGQIEEAEHWSRHLLETAYEARDISGVRVHAAVLTEVLTFAGRGHEAWRVLNTSLGLGTPGPAGNSFYRRGLSIGAAIQAADCADDLVTPLARELALRPTAIAAVCPLQPIAQAALDRATGEELVASRRLEQAGLEAADQGRLGCALLFWFAQDNPPSPETAQRIEDVAARSRIPLFDPYLALGRAVVARDTDLISAVLPQVSPVISPGLVTGAVHLLRRDGVDRAGLVRREVPTVHSIHHDDQLQRLSAREREVAMLARRGLTNREIARRLMLSIRTVENHMASVLRKLGVRSRDGLRNWSFSDS